MIKPSVLRACICLSLLPAASEAGDITVSYLNSIEMPAAATDQFGQPFTVTGLSGITALPDGRFAAVMDNSSKIVLFRPVLEPDGTLVSVTQVTGLTLSQSRDFEDLALLPGTGTALIADEGTSGPLSVVNLTTGTLSAGPTVPAIYANVRSNYGLESVTVSPDGQTAWTCSEEALTSDGALSTPMAGTRVRLQRYERIGGTLTPAGQWCYVTQPMHGQAIVPRARSGVSGLVALPGSAGLLALERSFAFSANGLFWTRIYSVATAGVTDTSAAPTLPVIGMTVCGKVSRYAGAHSNLEGLALGGAVPGGPGVPSGRRVLLGVTDDGNDVGAQLLVAFVIDGLTPACGPADIGSQGGATGADGLLDNNDFVAFIDCFFAADAAADLGRQGGESPGDGSFDNNDFVVFIDRFFAGC